MIWLLAMYPLLQRDPGLAFLLADSEGVHSSDGDVIHLLEAAQAIAKPPPIHLQRAWPPNRRSTPTAAPLLSMKRTYGFSETGSSTPAPVRRHLVLPFSDN